MAARLDAEAIRASLTGRWLGRGEGLVVLSSVDSTQSWLRAAAQRGTATPGAVVLAERQQAGRGRGANRWESPAGAGLYLTALLGSTLPTEDAARLTFAAAVAICDVLEPLGLRPTIKWPNDVLLDRRKLAGVLCELLPDAAQRATAAPGPRRILMGIGLNVDLRAAALPPELRPTVTSVAAALDLAVAPDRNGLAARLLDSLERRCEQAAESPLRLVDSWRRRWADRGCWVSVIPAAGPALTGRVLDIDAAGALQLQRADDGCVETIFSGSLRPSSDPEGRLPSPPAAAPGQARTSGEP